MHAVDYLAKTGIVSVSWNRLDSAQAKLPEKSINPLGDVQPSYIERIFKTQGSDARIAEALRFQVSDERMLTPSNYQSILEQLQNIAAAGADTDSAQREVFTRAAQLLDELAGNVRLLNLNRQIQTSS